MERKEYKKSILEYKDVQGAIICAREDGVEEGFEKGLNEGLEQGVKQGRMEGLDEGKRQLVRNMLDKGFDLALIAEISGLNHDEIIGMQQH